MYLWNVNALVKDLREDNVSEKEKLKYYLFTIVSNIVFTIDLSWYAVIPIIVGILGILSCFEVNSKNDNKQFLDRMICINVPLCIRFITIILPTAIIIFFIFPFLQNIVIIRVLDMIILLSYIMILRSYIEKVSQPELSIQSNNVPAN